MTAFQLQTVPFDEILSGEEHGFENAREKFDANEIKQLAESIETDGLIYPLILWERQGPDKGKEYVLIGGERRKRAIGILLKRNPKHVYAEGIPSRIVKADTLKRARYIASADNLLRADLSTYEQAQEVHRMRTMGDLQSEIAENLHKSESWVSRMLSTFEAAGTALRRAWRGGLIPFDSAVELATLEGEEQDEAVEEQLALRKNGKRGRSAAKKAAGKRTRKLQRASVKEFEELLIYCDEAPKDSRYLRGLTDGLRFGVGASDESDFDSEWKKFRKQIDKAAEAKADEDEK